MYINVVHFLLKLGGGGENNPVRSSISDQCYFYAKYDKNASTRACFFNFSGSKITHSKSTINNTRATFAYHSFYDNLRLHVPLRHFLIVCYCFCTILNYYVLSKSDVIKITCTHSMAMMISDGLN